MPQANRQLSTSAHPGALTPATHTEKLCKAHSAAHRALNVALLAAKRIEPRHFGGILINTSRLVRQDEHIVPPLKKSERRNVAASEIAMTHADIDRICEAYIRLSRRDGKWGWRHSETLGRLDNHGVFHALDAPCCPPSGNMVSKSFLKERPKFDKASLAAYRVRIADLHKMLDERLEAVRQHNDETGWTEAAKKLATAKQRERDTWGQLRERIETCSMKDLARVSRHQQALYDGEFRTFQLVKRNPAPRSFDEMTGWHEHMAQQIIWTLASRAKAASRKGGAK